VKIYGWQSLRGFNKNYFALIYPVVPVNPITKVKADYDLPPDLKDIAIRGRILSDDMSASVNWESSLEGSDAESNFSFTSALAQSGLLESFTNSNMFLGKTLINNLETIQIFKGIEAQEINLQLEFVAFKDPYVEVELPLQLLLKMALPQLTNGISQTLYNDILSAIKSGQAVDSKYFGYVPFDIVVNIGNRRYNADRFVIANISSDRDELKLHKSGYDLKRVVNLTLKSKKALNRDDIKVKLV